MPTECAGIMFATCPATQNSIRWYHADYVCADFAIKSWVTIAKGPFVGLLCDLCPTSCRHSKVNRLKDTRVSKLTGTNVSSLYKTFHMTPQQAMFHRYLSANKRVSY